MYDELRHLDALQFVSPAQGHGIIDIRNAYGKREDLDFDLKQYVHLTDEGRAYLSLLEELMRLTPAT